MSFVFYNPNPDRKIVDDCVIRAFTKVMNVDWETMATKLFMLQLEMHDIQESNVLWGEFLKRNGWKRYIIPNTCPQCYTVSNFCEDFPNGKYLLSTGDHYGPYRAVSGSHVVAVVDGKYYDAFDSGLEVPIYYWKEEPEEYESK